MVHVKSVSRRVEGSNSNMNIVSSQEYLIFVAEHVRTRVPFFYSSSHGAGVVILFTILKMSDIHRGRDGLIRTRPKERRGCKYDQNNNKGENAVRYGWDL